eukprot:3362470-Rhodomonas_salina.1
MARNGSCAWVPTMDGLRDSPKLEPFQIVPKLPCIQSVLDPGCNKSEKSKTLFKFVAVPELSSLESRRPARIIIMMSLGSALKLESSSSENVIVSRPSVAVWLSARGS